MYQWQEWDWIGKEGNWVGLDEWLKRLSTEGRQVDRDYPNCLGQEAGDKGRVSTHWLKLCSKLRIEKRYCFGRGNWEENQWNENGNEGWQERSAEEWTFWGEQNCWTKIQIEAKKWKGDWRLGERLRFLWDSGKKSNAGWCGEEELEQEKEAKRPCLGFVSRRRTSWSRRRS